MWNTRAFARSQRKHICAWELRLTNGARVRVTYSVCVVVVVVVSIAAFEYSKAQQQQCECEILRCAGSQCSHACTLVKLIIFSILYVWTGFCCHSAVVVVICETLVSFGWQLCAQKCRFCVLNDSMHFWQRSCCCYKTRHLLAMFCSDPKEKTLAYKKKTNS